VQLLGNYFARLGIQTTFVSPTRVDEWRAAVRPTTRLFFLETPSNPMTEISDIPALAEVAKKAGALLAVDNVFCTPILQRPLELGADLVIHSATKHLDGQGRVLGGAILGRSKVVMEHIFPFLRTAGPSLSPFNGWVILKGLETLDLRMRAHCVAALEMARWLESQPAVARVHYPWLESHPQHALAKRQQKAGGAVLSFELKGGRDAAFRLINGTRLISITANLGDVKTTITHPATTTHGRISPEARAAAGITDGLVRLAVGLEAVSDLQGDLERGLS
jgi:O-succinylhomoserine sulfhydrylase